MVIALWLLLFLHAHDPIVMVEWISWKGQKSSSLVCCVVGVRTLGDIVRSLFPFLTRACCMSMSVSRPPNVIYVLRLPCCINSVFFFWVMVNCWGLGLLKWKFKVTPEVKNPRVNCYSLTNFLNECPFPQQMVKISPHENLVRQGKYLHTGKHLCCNELA